MAVSAKFVADFTSFNAALDRADRELAKFETGIASVDKGLARFGTQFSGQKIVQDATNAAAAIEAIGGTSKLTESELARVSAMAKEATDKLRAMGQDVPPKLQALADAVKPPTEKIGFLSTAAGTATAALGGLFTLRAIANFTMDVIEAGDKIGDLSDRTGIGAVALQSFEAIAKQSGTSLDTMATLAQKLGVSLSKKDGAADAMKALHLSTQDLLAMRPEDRFTAVMTAIGGLATEAERARVGSDLMGRGFLEVAGLATTAFGDMRRAIEAGQAGFTDEQVKLLSHASDTFEAFKKKAQVLFAGLLIGLERAATVDLRFWDRVFGKEQFDATMDRIQHDLAEMSKDWKRVLADASANTQGIDALDRLRTSVSEAQRAYRGLSEATRDQIRDFISLGGEVAEADEKFTHVIGATQRLIDMDKLHEEQTKKNTDATNKRVEAERRLADAHAAQVTAIRDKLFGDDVIAKARLYAEAIGSVENITRLSADAQQEFGSVMTEAIDAMVLSGRASDRLTNDFEVMRLAAQKTSRDAAAAFRKMSSDAAEAAAQAAAAAAAQAGLAGLSIFGQRAVSPLPSANAAGGGITVFDGSTPPGSAGIVLPRASGGPVSAGASYWVGERGPELFVPQQSGSIVPNGGGTSVVVNISGPAFLRDRASMSELVAVIKQELLTSLGRQRKLQGA